jgi:hypothetical protein
MLHFKFGQDRLTEPHSLNTFELGRRAVEVAFEVSLRSPGDPSGPFRGKCSKERTATWFWPEPPRPSRTLCLLE